jgi:LPS-assembly protein
MWQFGWNGTWLSDKFFLNDYRLQGISFDTFYFQDIVSSVYLRGQGAQSFFDLSAYHFEGTTAYDDNRTLPTAVAPVFDYNRVINVPADRTNGLGGELTVDANVANINQTNAAFQSTGLQTFDSAYHLYNVCETQVGTTAVNTYFPGKCLLRGVAGDYTRASGQVSWQRGFIDPIGEVWKPFLFARLDGEATELNETGSITYASVLGTSTVANSNQAAFFSGSNQGGFARGMAGAGLEYRFPFTSVSSWGTQTITPIAQFIARPNEIIPRIHPNEDSQSLVFDDTNLFDWSRYSGYDRFETGTRANYGAQATLNFRNGGYLNVMAGQSYQLAGINSYATPDAANIGLSSGLDRRASDYIGRISFSPSSMFTFTAKGRFDPFTFKPRRIDLVASANLTNDLTASLQYASYEAQPLIGYEVRRQGLSLSGKYNVTKNYFVNGNVIFDLSRHYYNGLNGTAPLFSVAGLGIGGGYQDDCTTFTVNYTSVYEGGTVGRNQTITFGLQLRTLGDARISSALANVPVSDGIKPQ